MLNPGRKISETFLDFAAPLLYDLPSKEPEHKARQILSICFTAWNAVIFADVLNENKYLEQIRRLTADKPETAHLIQQMIARKRAHFAHDERLIGTWDVTRTDDGINHRADARDPHPLQRNTSRAAEDCGPQPSK